MILWLSYLILHYILQNDKAIIPWTKDWYTITTHVWEQLEKKVKETEDIVLEKTISNWKEKFSWKIKITWNNTTELININSVWIICDDWSKEESWNCVIDKCPNPIYLDKNWVTVKAKDCAEAWKTYQWNWETWYVAKDKDDVRKRIFSDGWDAEWNWEFKANRIITSKLTNMKEMFFIKTSFNQDISNWDTSNVRDMESMFQTTDLFNQPLNNWDTSNVTNIKRMFQVATSFNQDISNWNTWKVESMSGMFSESSSFNQPLNNWNTNNVTNMERMFQWASLFNQPLNNWNTWNVTNMLYMFQWASSFNQDISNWNFNKVKILELT